MKAVFALCLAGAAAIAPPRIELDLGSTTHALHTTGSVEHRPDNVNTQAGDYEWSATRTADARYEHTLSYTADTTQRGKVEQRTAGTVHVIALSEPIWRKHNDASYKQPGLPQLGEHGGHENAVGAGRAGAVSPYPVRSRQDYTIRCAICTETDCSTYHETTCKLPMARAYDHYNGTIPVVSTLYRVDHQVACTNGGTAPDSADKAPSGCDLGDYATGTSTSGENQESSIDFTKRATYLLKYDAEDASGNKAEQVVVALILDDLVAPTLSPCGGLSSSQKTVEAGSGWSLCNDASALDNYDGDVSKRIRVKVAECTAYDTDGTSCMTWANTPWTTTCLAKNTFNADQGCMQSDWNTFSGGNAGTSGDFHERPISGFHTHEEDDLLENEPLSDRRPGLFKVTYYVSDKAGIYGSEYADNYATNEYVVNIVDNDPPTIRLEGSDLEQRECGDLNRTDISTYPNQYVDDGATVFDKLDDLNAWDYATTSQTTQLNYNATVEGCLDNSGNPTQKDSCTCSDYATCFPADGNKWQPLDLRPYAVPHTYRIFYDAWDAAGNQAATKTRQVQVVDTQPPSLSLNSITSTPAQYVDLNNQTRNVIGDTDTIHYRLTNDGITAGHFDSDGMPTEAWDTIFDPGASCYDVCDRTVTDANVTTSWVDDKFNNNVKGTYTREYSCTDASGLTSTVQRKFEVDDMQDPIISVVDNDAAQNIFEAQHNVDYADPGATCWDYVDNVLDDQVVASGDLVQMAVPGTYVIQYDCQDLSGNIATTQKRTVMVIDTTCPQIKVNGAQVNYLESGFPFEDTLPNGFATAYDTLDGDLTHKVQSDGDSVTTASTFYMKSSCQAIKEFYPAAKTAEYYITRPINDHYERVLVWCNFNQYTEDPEFSRSTFFFVRGGKDVNGKLYGDPTANADSECPKHGLQLLPLSRNAMDGQGWFNDLKAQFPLAFPAGNVGIGSSYICVNPDFACGLTGNDPCERDDTNLRTRYRADASAQIGRYVIKYTVTDAQGNQNTCDDQTCQPDVCEWQGQACTAAVEHFWTGSLKWCGSDSKRKCNQQYTATSYNTANGDSADQANHDLPCNDENAKRTVIVKDDLPPVKSLSQKSNFAAAYSGYEATSLMAEQQPAASNAWFVGAAAAAVAGVAMLGLARRKQNAVVSVPV